MQDRPSLIYPMYVAIILCLAQAMSIVDRYIIAVVLEPLRHDLNLSDTQLGILMGPSFVLLFAVATLPLGRLADVANSRWMVVASVAFWSVATLACGMATDFHQLIAARMAVGLGEAMLVPAAMRLIGAYFPGPLMNRGASIFGAGSSLGRAIAFLGGGALLTLFTQWGSVDAPFLPSLEPWQALFVVAAAIGFAISLLALTIKEPPRAEQRNASSLRSALAWFWKGRGGYIPVFLGFSMVALTLQALASWTVSFFVREHGVAVGTASALLGTCSLVAGPTGAVFGGWLTERLQARGVQAPHLLIMALTLSAAAIFAAAFWLAPNAAAAAAAYIVLYGCLLMTAGPGYGGVLALTPPAHRGMMSALFTCVYVLLGAGMGPLVVGVLSDLALPSLGASLFAAALFASAIGIPVTLMGRGWFEAVRLDCAAVSATPGEPIGSGAGSLRQESVGPGAAEPQPRAR